MQTPTKRQTQKLHEMIFGRAVYGPRRTTSLDVPRRTIMAMVRAGWVREINSGLIEITPAGVAAYPVPLTQSSWGRWYHLETWVTLRLNPNHGIGPRYSGPRWQVEHNGVVINGDHYINVARRQAQAMATMILHERVREFDPATAASWESVR